MIRRVLPKWAHCGVDPPFSAKPADQSGALAPLLIGAGTRSVRMVRFRRRWR